MEKERGPLPESLKPGNADVQQKLDLKSGLRPPGGAENASGKQAESDKVLLAKLREFYRQLHSPFIAKEEEARVFTLALMCIEHEGTFGKHGTSKSALARRALSLIEAKKFETQLSENSTKEEIVGVYNPDKLRNEGILEYNTEGMLPEAEVAFIDEAYMGTAGLRVAFHSIKNERRFHNGGKIMKCPLMTVFETSEFVPYGEEDQATYDRDLFRYFTNPTPSDRTSDLMHSGRDIEYKGLVEASATVISTSDIRAIYKRLYDIDTSVVEPELISLINEVSDKIKGMYISDRRKSKVLKTIAANAFLEGRKTAAIEDLIVLKYVLPRDEDEAKQVAAILENLISPANHISRLDAATFSINAAIAALDKSPEMQIDYADATAAVSNARKYAKMLLKEYADKSLRKSARALLKSARIYAEKISRFALEAGQDENAAQDTFPETDQ